MDAAAFLGAGAVQVGDYGAAGIPMMPNVAGEASTKNQIFLYAVLTRRVGVAADRARLCRRRSTACLPPCSALGFIWYSHRRAARMPDGDAMMMPAKKLFAFSILYLFAIFSASAGRSS